MPPPGPPPVHVSSKAVIRTLRGLVLGTTCSLVLVSEDRRRRINAAHSVIRNAQTIRSASQYNAEGNAMVKALQEGGVDNSPKAIGNHLTKQAPKQASKQAPKQASKQAPKQASKQAPKEAPKEAPNKPKKKNKQPLPPSVAGNRIISEEELAALQWRQVAVDRMSRNMRTTPKILRVLPELMNRRKSWQAAKTKQLGPQLPFKPRKLPSEKLALKELLASLEKACLALATPDADKVAAAPKIIAEDVRHMKYVEILYGLITRFLAAATARRGESYTADVIKAGKPLIEYLLALQHRPGIKAVYSVISCLPQDTTEFFGWYVQNLDRAGMHRLIVTSFAVFRQPNFRVKKKKEDHESFDRICDIVVNATLRSFDQDADKVIKAIARCRSPSWPMKSSWLRVLMYAHWKRTKDFDEAQSVFSELRQLATSSARAATQKEDRRHARNLAAMSPGKAARKSARRAARQPSRTASLKATRAAFCNVGMVYRTMIHISCRAGQTELARELFDELVSLHAPSKSDVRILGYFSLEHAKKGDWPAVLPSLQSALDSGVAVAKDADEVKHIKEQVSEFLLVPIIKQHLLSHPLAETEKYVQRCLGDLQIAISKPMVTLLAREYGALRDANTFLSWLLYCASVGFKLDAAFANTILTVCNKHWRFHFFQLRTLYRKFKLLGPAFTDRLTTEIMANAAFDNTRSQTGVAHNVATLRPQEPSMPYAHLVPQDLVLGRSKYFRDNQELYVAMKFSLTAHKYMKALMLYKIAIKTGMEPSESCLSMAVDASIAGQRLRKQKHIEHMQKMGRLLPPDDPDTLGEEFDEAVRLIQEARLAGKSIAQPLSQLTIAYMDTVAVQNEATLGRESKNDNKTKLATAMKTILARLDMATINISGRVFNRAAYHLYKSGHMRGAIALAQAAANTPKVFEGGGGVMGYNGHNCAILAVAYARLYDVEGIQATFKGAWETGALYEDVTYRVLKAMRRHLNKSRSRMHAAAAGARSDAPDAERYNAYFHEPPDDVHITDTLREINFALESIAQVRVHRRSERNSLERGAVQIMQRAAKAAEKNYKYRLINDYVVRGRPRWMRERVTFSRRRMPWWMSRHWRPWWQYTLEKMQRLHRRGKADKTEVMGALRQLAIKAEQRS